MTRQADLERTLRHILIELRPYQSELILIGGWVPYLYRHYGGLGASNDPDTLTFELDMLVPRPLPAEGRPLLAEVLRNSEFRPDGGSPAAVWVRNLEAGEKIEFLTPHRGTAHGQGRVVPVPEQPGLGAIPLVELDVLSRHTRILSLPPRVGSPSVQVQVPTLGAYVVNKALTFLRRRAPAGEPGVPKLAKDLLYLRDLAAAGDIVITAMTQDLHAIAQSTPHAADSVREATSNLRLVHEDRFSHHIAAVAQMIVARGSTGSLALEEARTRAFLLDLYELFTDVADGCPQLPPGDRDDFD
jgi:hypothetical protein